MKRVHVLDRDICSSHSDLTIVPCSGKMKRVEKPRNQDRIDFYGLPSPFDLKDAFAYGKVSPIFPPTKNGGSIKYFAFAASVLNSSDPSALEGIGEQIGAITKKNEEIRVVEAPFLGCGDGGLHPREAMYALAKGFLASSHPDAVLQLCSDNALSASVARAAIDALFRTMATKNDEGQDECAGSFRYDFAFSFAGEQRGFAEQICSQLKANGATVFYDNDEQAELWGKNLYDHLYWVYTVAARYCVVVVSDEYNSKEWTNHERQSAQVRAFKEKGNEYLLPIRVENAQLKGLSATVAYVDADLGVEKIVELLLRKIGRRPSG